MPSSARLTLPGARDDDLSAAARQPELSPSRVVPQKGDAATGSRDSRHSATSTSPPRQGERERLRLERAALGLVEEVRELKAAQRDSDAAVGGLVDGKRR
jgi:hypothetical protein